ncbi:MAG: tetratricopeptide repeat protein [bacterium]|nr:tetratricopeptide repeat protein [bacterium]
MGEKEKAITAWDAVLVVRPNDANAYYYKGIILYDLSKFEEALADYGTAPAQTGHSEAW